MHRKQSSHGNSRRIIFSTILVRSEEREKQHKKIGTSHIATRVKITALNITNQKYAEQCNIVKLWHYGAGRSAATSFNRSHHRTSEHGAYLWFKIRGGSFGGRYNDVRNTVSKLWRTSRISFPHPVWAVTTENILHRWTCERWEAGVTAQLYPIICVQSWRDSKCCTSFRKRIPNHLIKRVMFRAVPSSNIFRTAKSSSRQQSTSGLMPPDASQLTSQTVTVTKSASAVIGSLAWCSKTSSLSRSQQLSTFHDRTDKIYHTDTREPRPSPLPRQVGRFSHPSLRGRQIERQLVHRRRPLLTTAVTVRFESSITRWSTSAADNNSEIPNAPFGPGTCEAFATLCSRTINTN